jgi:hypothetical protein
VKLRGAMKFPRDMDPACVAPCAALCALPGIETESSCEGHSKRPPMIFFKAASLEALYPIARAIDRRYYAYTPDRRHRTANGILDDWWHLRVTETDLFEDRLCFYLTTPTIRKDAARMLSLLAENIADAAYELAQWAAYERLEQGRGAARCVAKWAKKNAEKHSRQRKAR